MSHNLDLTKELASTEVKNFEKRMSERYGRDMTLRGVPLKNFVKVDTGLIETKVASMIIEGANDEAGFYPKLVRMHEMSSEKEVLPISSMRDYKVRRGRFAGSQLEESGGKTSQVTLDVTNEKSIRYVYLAISELDVQSQRFALIEDSIRNAGKALAKHVLGEITTRFVADAGNTQALAADKRFVAIMKLIDKIATSGFKASAVIFESSDFVDAITEETAGGTMPWLGTLQNSQPLGDNFATGMGLINGLAGTLFGRLPVYVVANDTGLATNIVAVDVQQGEVFGLYHGMQFAENVNSIRDLVEAKISMRYDLVKANANAIGKVTGA